jgi:uncharacterized lipoprotein NlpE involved in copper resistance
MQTKKALLGIMAVAMLALAGCANQKEPATQAVAAAEAALSAIKGDAARFLPNDLQGVEATLTGLKDALAKGDFKSVVAKAPALMASLTSLKDATSAKKAEFDTANAAAMTEWGALSADLPKMVSAIESRVGVLSGSKRLPRNLTQAAFDSAKAGLDTIKATWNEASAAATAGNAVDAVAKAKMVQEKGNEVLKLLGMSAG